MVIGRRRTTELIFSVTDAYVSPGATTGMASETSGENFGERSVIK